MSAYRGVLSTRTASRVPSVVVQAVHSPPGKPGRVPPEQQPDPFDRHASARDRQHQAQNHSRANVSRSRNNTFASQNRRRGRPAHLRSPDDTPLRDGNRDRLIGLLTERSAKTLLVYLQETNPTVYHWLFVYIKENPIPLQGTWDEISGEDFLRKMLSTPPETAKIELGRGELFDNIASQGVDPRQLAQRIMEIRVQLSKEFVQDLNFISEENSVLLRETLQVSLANALHKEPIKELPPRDLSKVFIHPELLTTAGGLHPEVADSHPELLPVVKEKQREASNSPSPDATAAASTTPAAAAAPQPPTTPPTAQAGDVSIAASSGPSQPAPVVPPLAAAPPPPAAAPPPPAPAAPAAVVEQPKPATSPAPVPPAPSAADLPPAA